MPGLTGFAYKEKPMPNFAALLAAVLATKHGWGEEDFAALKDRYAAPVKLKAPFADTPRRKPGWQR